MADGDVNFVLESDGLNEVQTLLWHCGGKVVDERKVEETEYVSAVDNMDGFRIATSLSDHHLWLSVDFTNIFLHVKGSDSRPYKGFPALPFGRGDLSLLLRDNSLYSL